LIGWWVLGSSVSAGGERGGWCKDLASRNGSIREGERRHRRQHGCRRQAAPWVRDLAPSLLFGWNGMFQIPFVWSLEISLGAALEGSVSVDFGS
jgi:hypothetical protein